MLPDPSILNSVARLVAETLREQGVDPAPAFAAAGVDPSSLHVPRGRVPFDRDQRFWAAAAAASGDGCFGLRVGERVRPVTFGVLGVAWVASGSLRDALGRLCRYSRVISTAPHDVRLVAEGDATWLRYEYPAALLLVPQVTVVALFAAVVALVRMVSRPGAGPREVHLRCAADGQARRLEQFFGCPVRFGADTDAMAFANDLLDAPLAGEDPEIARDHDEAAERYLDSIDLGGTAAEVRRVLVGLLPSGEVGLDRVAARLGRGQSTLQRRLQQEGVSYRAVLEATRRQLAERYLADAGLSLGEIAFLVGFTDQSSFSRSFRRWTGKSPRAWRQQVPPAPG